MSPKQQAIIDHIKVNGSITKAQAVELVGGNIHHNAQHYVGQILARMIRRGMILRKERGVYIRNDGKVIKSRVKCEKIEPYPTPVYRCKYSTDKRTERCIICPLKS